MTTPDLSTDPVVNERAGTVGVEGDAHAPRTVRCTERVAARMADFGVQGKAAGPPSANATTPSRKRSVAVRNRWSPSCAVHNATGAEQPS